MGRWRGGILPVLILVGFPTLCPSADLLVPDEYSTIQEAIDAADDGDRVLVRPISPEYYTEIVRIEGRMLTLASASPEQRPTVVGLIEEGPLIPTLSIVNGASTEVRGFEIVGSFSLSAEIRDGGAAAACASASASFVDCHLRGQMGFTPNPQDVEVGDGGPALWADVGGTVSVTRCALLGGSGNIPSFTFGGGLGGDGGAALLATGAEAVLISDSTLQGGRGPDGEGGAVWISATGGDGGSGIEVAGVGFLRVRSSSITGGEGGDASGEPANGGDGGHGVLSAGPSSIVISDSECIGRDGGHGFAGGNGGHGLGALMLTHVCSSEVTAEGGRGHGLNGSESGLPAFFDGTSWECLGFQPTVDHLIGHHILEEGEIGGIDHNADGVVDVADLVRVGLLDD